MDPIKSQVFNLCAGHVVVENGDIIRKSRTEMKKGNIVVVSNLDNNKKMSIQTLVATIKEVSTTQFASNAKANHAMTVIGTLMNRLIVKRDSLKYGKCWFDFFKNRKITNYDKLINDLNDAYSNISKQRTEDDIPRFMAHPRTSTGPSFEEFAIHFGISANSPPRERFEVPMLSRPIIEEAPSIDFHYVTKDEAKVLIEEMFSSQMAPKTQERFAKFLVQNELWLSKRGALNDDFEKRVFNQMFIEFLGAEFPAKQAMLKRLETLQEEQSILIDPMLLLHRCTESLVTKMDPVIASVVLKMLKLDVSDANITKLMNSDFQVANMIRLSPLERAEVDYILEERGSASPPLSPMLSPTGTPISIASSESTSPIGIISRLFHRRQKSPGADQVSSPIEASKLSPVTVDTGPSAVKKRAKEVAGWLNRTFKKGRVDDAAASQAEPLSSAPPVQSMADFLALTA